MPTFNMQACYSPADLMFVLSLFITILVTVGAFILLMANLIRGAFETVRDLKQNKVP